MLQRMTLKAYKKQNNKLEYNKLEYKSKELPLLNNRTPRMKLIVRTRQLAKKPSVHSQKPKSALRDNTK